MSITVTPDAAFWPPRMKIDLRAGGFAPVPDDGMLSIDQAQAIAQLDGYSISPSSDSQFYSVSGTPGQYLAVPDSIPTDNVFDSVAVYRVQAGRRTLLRAQPASGGSSVTAYDYECPYGAPVSYEAVETLVQSGPVTEWYESWSDLDDWSILSGDASVAFSALTLIGSPGAGGIIERTLGGVGNYRVSAADLKVGSTLDVFWGSGWGVATLTLEDATTIGVGVERAGREFTIPSAAVYNVSIDVVGSTVTFTVNGSTFSLPRSSSTSPTSVRLNGGGTTAVWGGPVTAAVFGGDTAPTKATERSVPVTLTPASGWLVHPLVPSLSVPVSTTDRSLIGVHSIGEVAQAGTATVHQILGQRYPVVSTSGPRAADAFTLTLAMRNADHRHRLVALLADQTPVLVRLNDPALQWVDDFYSVGDLTLTRAAQNTRVQRSLVTMPLQAAQSPAGGVQNPGWSWAALASSYTSWDDVANAYATWSDVAANNTRS